MQILKGQVLKSVTVESILKSTKSFCFVYYNTQLPFENYFVNNKYATLNQLKGYLQEYIENKNPNVNYEYFILYTNNTERELSEIIEWLNMKELDFNCRCILIACRF